MFIWLHFLLACLLSYLLMHWSASHFHFTPMQTWYDVRTNLSANPRKFFFSPGILAFLVYTTGHHYIKSKIRWYRACPFLNPPPSGHLSSECPFSIERVSGINFLSWFWRQELNKAFRNFFLPLGGYDYTFTHEHGGWMWGLFISNKCLLNPNFSCVYGTDLKQIFFQKGDRFLNAARTWRMYPLLFLQLETQRVLLPVSCLTTSLGGWTRTVSFHLQRWITQPGVIAVSHCV